MTALDRGTDAVATWHADMFETGAALLARARRAEVIAPATEDGDVLKMVSAIAWAAQGPEAALRTRAARA